VSYLFKFRMRRNKYYSILILFYFSFSSPQFTSILVFFQSPTHLIIVNILLITLHIFITSFIIYKSPAHAHNPFSYISSSPLRSFSRHLPIAYTPVPSHDTSSSPSHLFLLSSSPNHVPTYSIPSHDITSSQPFLF